MLTEVQAVSDALARSVEDGRQRLSWLVSRDTAALDEVEIREAAIETLSENLVDAWVAPWTSNGVSTREWLRPLSAATQRRVAAVGELDVAVADVDGTGNERIEERHGGPFYMG